VIIDTVQEDRQEQAVVDVAEVEKRAPGGHSQLHGGVEASAPGARVDIAVGLAPMHGPELIGRGRERVADLVVPHCDGRDGGELGCAAVIE
jgi:hypothetical protein